MASRLPSGACELSAIAGVRTLQEEASREESIYKTQSEGFGIVALGYEARVQQLPILEVVFRVLLGGGTIPQDPLPTERFFQTQKLPMAKIPILSKGMRLWTFKAIRGA